MRPRAVLVDAALLLTAVGCLALAASLLLPLFQPAAPTGAATARLPGSVLVLRAPGAPGQHLAAAAARLGWRLGDAPLALDRRREPELAVQEAVVVQAADGPAEAAAAAVARVRRQQPGLRIVLVGPLGLVPGPQVAARDLLRQAAVDAGADFVDPVGSRWAAEPGLVEGGRLTERGAASIGARLALAVRRAELVRSAGTGSPGSR